MRMDEVVQLSDVLKGDQYLKLLRGLKSHATKDINITRIKSRVIQSWKKGMKSRKHYDDLLGSVNISLSDLIRK